MSDLSKVKNLPHTETLNSIVRIWDQDFMTRSIMVDILFSCGGVFVFVCFFFSCLLFKVFGLILNKKI